MVEMVKRRVVAKIDRKVGDEETLVVIRTLEEDGTWKHDYHLSNAPVTTSDGEKSGRRRSRFRRYANGLLNTCDVPAAATHRPALPASANAGWIASSLHGSITTKDITDCHHEGFINVDNPIQ